MAESTRDDERTEVGDANRERPEARSVAPDAEESASIDEYRYGAPREHHFLHGSGTIDDPTVLR